MMVLKKALKFTSLCAFLTSYIFGMLLILDFEKNDNFHLFLFTGFLSLIIFFLCHSTKNAFR